MPGFLSLTAQAHINSIRANAPLFMHHYSDLTKRNHLLLNLMKKWGNIEYNASRISTIWQILVRQPEIRVFQNTVNKTFADHAPFEQMQIDARGYEGSDLLKELEWKENQGITQLINLYDFKMNHLGTTIVERLQEWLYRDGDDPNYQDGFNGFESALHPMNASTTGAIDPDPADKVCLPEDSYGGHATNLATFGGSWSTDLAAADRLNTSQGAANDWPYGQGDSEYDATAPVLWQWDSTAWGSGSGEWVDNVEEVCRESVNVLRNRNGMGTGPIDVCMLLAPNLYPDAENYYSQRFRTITPASGGEQGFPMPQSLFIDGLALKSDYGCPANVGYGLCPNHIEAFFYQTMNPGGPEPMIDVFGPDWSPEHGAYLMRVSVYGNLRLQPKFMFKLATNAHYEAQ